MKLLQKIVAPVMSVILLFSAFPAALAEPSAGDMTNVRLETEDYVKTMTQTTVGKADTATVDEKTIGIFNNSRLNDVICLGEADTTGLQTITMRMANANATASFEFYIDGPGHIIATLTTEKTADWFSYKEFSVSVLPTVPAVQLAGLHTLYMKVVASSNNMHGGNIDYVDLWKAPVTGSMVKTSKTVNFAERIAKDLSSGTYSVNWPSQDNVYRTYAGAVLAYRDISLDGLTGLSLDYAPENKGSITVNISRGATFETSTPLLSCPLENDKRNGAEENWYDTTNYRATSYDFPQGADLSGTDTLYFELTTTGGARPGNFRTFILGYEEDISGAWQLEAEDYVWGAAARTDADWLRNAAAQLEGTKDGDVFYLGKSDLSDLQFITARVAQGAGDATYTFYADMAVDFDRLTAYAPEKEALPVDHDRYTYADGAITGGVKLGEMTIRQTGREANQWDRYCEFYSAVDEAARQSLAAGEHELYLKLTVNGTGYAGNLESIRLGGLKKGCMNTGSNFPGDQLTVDFLGKYNEVFATKTVSSASELKTLLDGGLTAPVLHGYVFRSWSENDCEALYDTGKGGTVTIQAIYESDTVSTYTLDFDALRMTARAGDIDIGNDTPLTFDQRITVTAGEAVAYWILDGAKVGFGQSSYTFYISGHNQIAVVLTGEDTPPTDSSVVIQQAYMPGNGSAFTFTVIAQTSVPNGRVSEYGVIYSGSLTALRALANGTSTDRTQCVQVTSSKQTAGLQYMTSLLNIRPDRYRYAVAYAVIDGQTIYSCQYARVHSPAEPSAAAAPEILTLAG